MRRLARLLPLLVLLLLLPLPARAHPIDEVEGNAVLDLRSADGQRFDLTIVLRKTHLEAYTRLVEALGLPPERDREALARSMGRAFGFGPCTVAPARGERFVELGAGTFLGMRYALTCPTPLRELEVRRLQYQRDRTRTTLYVHVAIADRPPVRLLVPPSAEVLRAALDGSGKTSTEAATARRQPAQDTAQGALPTDALPIEDFPPLAGAAPSSRPPWPVLQAWATEGALHLAFGPDHLLFLLTLVVAAARPGVLLLAVTAFSLGHMATMALALVFGWAPLAWLDIVIGGTIAFSAWRARRRAGEAGWRLPALAFGFGLVHGLGFGYGLQHLVGGVDQVVWPLVSFGLGLDLAQVAWVLLAWTLWRGAHGLARRGRLDAARLQAATAWTLVAAGLTAGVVAAIGYGAG